MSPINDSVVIRLRAIWRKPRTLFESIYYDAEEKTSMKQHLEEATSMKIQKTIAGRDQGSAPSRWRSLGRSLSAAFLFAIALPAALQAQITAASISGQVRDPSQSVITGATVTVKNVDTSATRAEVTSQDGRYTFSQLIPGSYVVTVSKAGFASYTQSNITLQASQALELNPQLTIGSVSEQVLVTSAPSLLDTEDANHDVTLTSQQVQDLPISSHSSLGSVWATGGVVSVHTGMNPNNPASNDAQEDRFSMDGGRDMASAILVDGISLTAGDYGGSIAPPSAEATAETHAFRNTYDTQYGKTDGGVLSLTTRNGTPTFHGSTYFDFQGQALNANTWGNDRTGIAKTPYTSVLYGGHVAGPIWRSKHMYFFTNYEGSRNSQPASSGLQSLPTPAECNGDFSNVFSKSGTSYVLSTLYDPTTQVANSNGTYTRTSFIAENGGNTTLAAGVSNPANIIPQSKINPQGQLICKLYSQLPAAPASVTAAANASPQTNVNNYSATASTVNTQERLDFRGDWAPTEKFTAFGTWMRQYSVSGAAAYYGHGLDTGSEGKNPTNRILLSGTYVPSPTLVLNVTGAASVWHQNNYSLGSLEGANATLFGFSSALASQFAINNPPNLGIGNYQGLGQGRNYYYTLRNNDFQVNGTKTLNSHSFRFGVQLTVQQLNDFNENSANFGFDRNLTSSTCAETTTSAPCLTSLASTSSTTTGDAVASLLLGTLSSSSAGYAVVPAATQKYLSFYGEDAWKVNSKLTFNYGMRYEIQFGRTDRYNRYNHFDPNIINTTLSQLTGTPVKGGLVFANSENRGLWKTPFNNLAPRLGLSYRVRNNVTARAGYGIFYIQNTSEAPNTNSDGFSANTTGNATQNLNAGLAPQDGLSNPFPNGLVQPTGSSLGVMQDVGNSVSSAYYARPTPYSQTYSAGIQYQTPINGVVEIGYQGSQGRRLPVGYGQNVNQLPSPYLYSAVTGVCPGSTCTSTLNNKVNNPFAGQGQFSATNQIAYNQLLRPYPQFTSVNISQDQTLASASYNALLVSFTQRLSEGTTVIINYQYSKAIDNTSETGYNNDSGARDIYNLSLERSVSGHDMPQQFTGTVILKIPFGRGRRFGSNMNRIVDAFAGGWQLSTVTIINEGFPISITDSSNPISSYGFGESRPNVTSEAAIRPSSRTLLNWFNATAFTTPCWASTSTTTATASCPAGTGPTFNAIGNIRRFEAADRQGSYIRPDMTLQKNFAITGERVIAVHIAAFNLTNTPYYGAPNTSVGSSTFGQVTGTGTGYKARTVELGGRFNF